MISTNPKGLIFVGHGPRVLANVRENFSDLPAGVTPASHKPQIIPAIYVKPFVNGEKNNYNDAEAIAETTLRPNLSGRP
jgi:hypothetical protein